MNRNIHIISSSTMYSLSTAITSTSSIPTEIFTMEDVDYLIDACSKDDSKGKKEKISFLNFSDVLNSLDGISLTHGRIIIMTTNHIEKIPENMLRKGRVDLSLNIGYFTIDMFKEYLKSFYDYDIDISNLKINENVTGAILQNDVITNATAEEMIKKYTTKIS